MKNNRTELSRRRFLQASLGAVAAFSTGPRFHAAETESPKQSRRDRVLALLDSSREMRYVPAAFFMHFGGQYNFGRAAIERHLEYFRATEMDFVKIQYELGMPGKELKKPSDWASIVPCGDEFFEPMIALIRGIAKDVKKEALILPTVYSPFMCAKQIAGTETVLAHAQEDPDAVAKGMEIITAALKQYLRSAIAAGADGFYMSTQGAETNRFGDSEIFAKVVRPFDLALMNDATEKCDFNILHICDYEGKYEDLSPFASYPCQAVNTPIRLQNGTPITMRDAAKLFDRPVMGGLDRHGVLSKGSPEQIRDTVEDVLKNAPERFILGADCTVGGVPWETLRTVVRQAHEFRS